MVLAILRLGVTYTTIVEGSPAFNEQEVEVTFIPLSCIENSRCFPVGSAMFLSNFISTLSTSFAALKKLGTPGGETLTI